jgi:hypothetical protein
LARRNCSSRQTAGAFQHAQADVTDSLKPVLFDTELR